MSRRLGLDTGWQLTGLRCGWASAPLFGHGETSRIYPEQRKQTSKPFHKTRHFIPRERLLIFIMSTGNRLLTILRPKRRKEICVKSHEFIHPMQSFKRIPSPKLLCKAIHILQMYHSHSHSVISHHHNIKDTILVSALLNAKEGLAIRLCRSPLLTFLTPPLPKIRKKPPSIPNVHSSTQS